MEAPDRRNHAMESDGAEMTVEFAAAEIERLRSIRAFRPKNDSIVAAVEQERTRADRVHRRLGELISLWQELAPPNVAASTSLAGLRAGILSVEADSAAIMYELDQALRGGMLASLRARYRGTLTRVRTQLSADGGT